MGASEYCFGNFSDVGKLMGLAPFGKPGLFNEELFDLRDGRVFFKEDWINKYREPAEDYEDFQNRFQYFADIAYGVQKELERAIIYMVNERISVSSSKNLCYAGGVALNAVANAKILKECDVDNIYMQPAAGDNGLAIGCAFYGWLEVLKQERKIHNGSSCFGKIYSNKEIERAIKDFGSGLDPWQAKPLFDAYFKLLNKGSNKVVNSNAIIQFSIEDVGVYQMKGNETIETKEFIFGKPDCIIKSKAQPFIDFMFDPSRFDTYCEEGKIEVTNFWALQILADNFDLAGISEQLPKMKSTTVDFIQSANVYADTASLLAQGKTIGWFQDGCEFGPRALGRRSILADPRNVEVRDFINREVKFREDFRPFAPSVLEEDASTYFEMDHKSPYMILVDQVLPEWKEKLKAVVHENNSCRVQTVTEDWNPKYYKLLQEFKKESGVSVLVNTSFNRKGMPMVETPDDALEFYFACALDYLVIGDYIVSKTDDLSEVVSKSTQNASLN
jgi:predicted NodU family carbamoyl transferase